MASRAERTLLGGTLLRLRRLLPFRSGTDRIRIVSTAPGEATLPHRKVEMICPNQSR